MAKKGRAQLCAYRGGRMKKIRGNELAQKRGASFPFRISSFPTRFPVYSEKNAWFPHRLPLVSLRFHFLTYTVETGNEARQRMCGT